MGLTERTTSALMALVVVLLSACGDATMTPAGDRLSGTAYLQASINGVPFAVDSGHVTAQVGAAQFPSVIIAGIAPYGSDSLQQFGLQVQSFTVGTELTIRPGFGDVFYEDASHGSSAIYILDSAGTAGVTVDGYDPVDRLISGRFHATLRRAVIDSAGFRKFTDPLDIVTVTNGRFKARYTDAVIYEAATH